MSERIPENIEQLREAVAASIHAHWKLFLARGVVMMALGLVFFLLACFIWRGWPATADWAIGLLVGVSMFALGPSPAMTALAARAIAAR
ncbi:MAG TPA: hypothetical protein VGA50_01625 [Kiloniellales bacterium]